VIQTGAVLLAGGRSTRMGSAKALLPWHGGTLLDRTVRVLGRAVTGPVLVVAAAGQSLPPLPDGARLLTDPIPDQGPLQGLVTGLTALEEQDVPAAFVCSTDLPFLHPAFVSAVLARLTPGVDLAVPVTDGFVQPLAAGYQTWVAGRAQRLLDAGQHRLTALLPQCRTLRLEPADLLSVPALAAADPTLASTRNLNRPQDYRAALAAPAPWVQINTVRTGGQAPTRPASTRHRAATLAQAASCVGAALGRAGPVTLNGRPVSADPLLPLVSGDRVEFG
jgi:molybdenum cofactor guanylyltransferase